MRKDMQKVIVERPRAGHRNKNAQCRAERKKTKMLLKGDVSEDKIRTKQTVRPLGYYDIKELNENLNPLRRFLKSRVGQPWDKVYSEVRQSLKGATTLGNHVLVHLEWEVQPHIPVMRDAGGFYVYSYTGKYYKRPGELFVYQGILREIPESSRKNKKLNVSSTELLTAVSEDGNRRLRLFYDWDGALYLVHEIKRWVVARNEQQRAIAQELDPEKKKLLERLPPITEESFTDVRGRKTYPWREHPAYFMRRYYTYADGKKKFYAEVKLFPPGAKVIHGGAKQSN